MLAPPGGRLCNSEAGGTEDSCLWTVFTGSSGSKCSDGQKEGGGRSQSESNKGEVSAPLDKRLVAETPSDDSARRPATSSSGLHGNKDSQEPPPAPSPSRSEQRDLSASRQSFCLAMGNPGDFFVDVM